MGIKRPRRLVLFVGLGLLLALVARILLLQNDSKLSTDDVARVQLGSSLSDVITEFGSVRPMRMQTIEQRRVFGWDVSDGLILVELDEFDKVIRATVSRRASTFQAIMYRLQELLGI